jgi:Fic family protein
MIKDLIKDARKEKDLKLREVAHLLGIDQALVSKFESGDRIPTEEQLKKISVILEIPYEKLAVSWLKQKIFREIGYSDFAYEAVNMVREEMMEYRKKGVVVPSSDLQTILDEIDAGKARLEEIRHLDNFRIAQALELEYTFESNRIEGNTLTLRETDLVVNEGLTVSGKSLREHLEAINHKDAISYMKQLASLKTDLNEREILSIHNLVLRGIHPEDAGRYRDVQVMIKGSAHTPPQPILVREHMEDYFSWYLSNQHKLHPVVLAAEMHERLVTIHPFIDGNGRTARLVMNLILLRHGYVIANIKGDYETRMSYYEALESVQTKKTKDAFQLFAALTEKESLQRYLSIVDIEKK